MRHAQLSSPYDRQDIEEVQLAAAPLVRVLAQVRHAPLTVLAGDAGTKTAMYVANALADSFPIFKQVKSAEFLLSSHGIEEREGTSTTWKLTSRDEHWHVSFSRDFISIETDAYRGRTDFCRRLAAVVATYTELVDPPPASRLGVRYTNRIDDPSEVARLPEYIRPEILGPVASKLPPGVTLAHSINQAQFASADSGLIVNWGLLPPNGTFDAGVTPSAETSWFLDIDAYTTAQFGSEAVEGASRQLADQVYRCFRWVVTEEFLAAFGGQ